MAKLRRITVAKRKDGLYVIRRAGKSYGGYKSKAEAQRMAAKDRAWWKQHK